MILFHPHTFLTLILLSRSQLHNLFYEKAACERQCTLAYSFRNLEKIFFLSVLTVKERNLLWIVLHLSLLKIRFDKAEELPCLSNTTGLFHYLFYGVACLQYIKNLVLYIFVYFSVNNITEKFYCYCNIGF